MQTIDPEMAQAFTNRPKLSRTPNTDNNNLMYEEGEFGNQKKKGERKWFYKNKL